MRRASLVNCGVVAIAPNMVVMVNEVFKELRPDGKGCRYGFTVKMVTGDVVSAGYWELLDSALSQRRLLIGQISANLGLMFGG